MAHVKALGPRLDAFAAKLLAAEKRGEQGNEIWTDTVIAEVDQLDNTWESMPFAPPEFATLQDVLSGYIHAFLSHQVFCGKAHWNPSGENQRYRLETAEEKQYYYGAWWVLLKRHGWDFQYYTGIAKSI